MGDGPKPVAWVGSSKRDLQAFPELARREAGFQLFLLQRGEDPDDWKPFSEIGPGAREIRVKTTVGGGRAEHRVLYVAKFAEAVYVLHAFRKKSRKTSRKDVALGKQRYAELLALREKMGG